MSTKVEIGEFYETESSGDCLIYEVIETMATTHVDHLGRYPCSKLILRAINGDNNLNTLVTTSHKKSVDIENERLTDPHVIWRWYEPKGGGNDRPSIVVNPWRKLSPLEILALTI